MLILSVKLKLKKYSIGSDMDLEVIDIPRQL